MEAVKQGAATVAVKSKTHVVLCALKVILFIELNLNV
jgi:20S proteasome alpha/beta subunit